MDDVGKSRREDGEGEVLAEVLALRAVRERIERACERAGRDPAEVTLIGAAKTVPAERLRKFLDAGLNDVGENYVQEGVRKMAVLQPSESRACGHLSWHLIGALQRNKAREAVQHFEVIHSVDRIALAEAIDKAGRETRKVQQVLLQVNLGDEASKAGCAPEEVSALLASCAPMTNLAVRGLMCLPPYHDNPEQTRPYFQKLRALRDELFQEYDGVVSTDGSSTVNRWHLSMGMSHDFEIALEEGATMVRIGTLLFGERDRP